MIQADSGASKSTTATSAAVGNAVDAAATGPAPKNPPKRRRRPIPGPPISIPGVTGAAPAPNPNPNHGNMAGVPGMPHPMAFMPYGYFIPPPPPGGGPFFPNGNGGGGGASGGSNNSSGPASAGSGNMGMMPYPAWHPMMMMQLQPPPQSQRLLNPEDGGEGRDNEADNASENAAESTPAAANGATSGRAGAGDGTNSQRAGSGTTPPSFGPYGAAMAGATPMYFPPPYMMAQQQMMLMQQQQQHYAAATAAAMQSRPSSSSQASSSNSGNGGSSGPSAAAAALQYIQPGRGIVKCLSLACDVEHLSDYQILVRQQLELFEADERDVECNTQGRKRPVTIHQVGLRCRHCALTPYRHRGRGAVYYPAKLEGVYQAAQNMAGSHLCKPGVCPHLPPLQQQQLKELRSRRDNASGGKQYWADGCRALGLAETPNHGLRFTANTENASLFPSASSSIPASSSIDPLAGSNNEGSMATSRVDHHTAAHDTTPSNNVESYDVEHDGWVV
jgi:hypothetical protein